jgi:plasmid stability protein
MKYRIKLKRTLLSRETTLDWQLSREQSIDEAKRRLEWKAATSARVVDANEREVWRSAPWAERRRLWLAGQAAVIALGLAGLVVAGLLDGA